MKGKSTADHIDNMVKIMEYSGDQLKRVALKMRETGDLSYSAEAINIVANTVTNLRLDLLISRPLRDLGEK